MNRRVSRTVATLFAAIACLCVGAPAFADQFVWKVPGENGNTVYLAGSVHLLPEKAYPLPPAYDQAYRDSEIIAFETDMDAMQSPELQFQLLAQGSYPQGTSLSDTLPPPMLARLRDIAPETGLPMMALERFKPWFVGTLIELSSYAGAGYRPELGLDVHFHKRARQDGKALLALETIEQHMQVLTELSPAQSQAYLQDTLDNIEHLQDAPDELYGYWRSGDANGLAAYVDSLKQSDRSLYRRLVDDRNQAWLNTLEALLRGNADAMVVVGALHLVGERGLPALLAARGYRPRQF